MFNKFLSVLMVLFVAYSVHSQELYKCKIYTEWSYPVLMNRLVIEPTPMGLVIDDSMGKIHLIFKNRKESYDLNSNDNSRIFAHNAIKSFLWKFHTLIRYESGTGTFQKIKYRSSVFNGYRPYDEFEMDYIEKGRCESFY